LGEPLRVVDGLGGTTTHDKKLLWYDLQQMKRL